MNGRSNESIHIILAYREAGHAVMCLACGVGFAQVSLDVPARTHSLCRHNDAASTFYRDRSTGSQQLKVIANKALLIAFAGPAAIASKKATIETDALAEAWVVAENMAWYCSIHPDKLLATKSQEARHIIRQHWLQVVQVATWLEENQRLEYHGLHDWFTLQTNGVVAQT